MPAPRLGKGHHNRSNWQSEEAETGFATAYETLPDVRYGALVEFPAIRTLPRACENA